MENNIEEEEKKTGKNKKGVVTKSVIKEEQNKFFVDLSKDDKSLGMVSDLLKKCNEKDYGAVVTFKDLCLFGLGKVTDKDIEKIQEQTLSKMEKVERL